MASQWPGDLERRCEEYNQQHYAPGDDEESGRLSTYLEHDRKRTVVTVEFELPDNVFLRQPRLTVKGDFPKNIGGI
jgi:hypothetical protein